MVEIKIVRTKKERKEFLRFEDKLYSECEFFVPRIYKEEKQLFNLKKNPSLTSNESTAYLAYQEGKIVGRVLCFFNRVEKEEKNIVRFSHLDFINDTSVSYALLDTVMQWAKFLKADKVIGDVSFNELGNVGILNSGFELISTYKNRYNYPYYSEHLKSYGFTKSKILFEYQLRLKNTNQDIKSDFEDYKIVEGVKAFKIDNYARKIFDLMYENSLYDYPIVIDTKVYERYFKIIDKLFTDENLIIVTNEFDDVVGVMLLTNNTTQALQVTKGKMMYVKNMYSMNTNNSLDISFYATVKKDKEIIDNLLASKVIDIMKIRNISILNTNLWFDDFKNLVYSKLFDINVYRERILFGKKLTKGKLNKAGDDLIGPVIKARKSELK